MKTADIREKFLTYFEGHEHQRVSSSSLIPDNDPTLLFTNAGMNQFKNSFLGLEDRGYSRAASSQKCVRAGGKHNDLENVGFTARHHTFFEMLGNFSFGDYFKKDAIHFAWEFVTKELGLPKDKLYVTVFETDDEAADIWHKQEGIPSDRIYRFGEKDNFWRMGDTGPCGPCSEIFYDLGLEVGGDPKANVMGGEGDRYMEIWNLVFMQYFEDGKGGRSDLPKPSVDTGAGLERLAVVMQNELSNYHTDTFRDIIGDISKASGKEYVFDTSKLKAKELEQVQQQNVAFRVLSDHARAAAFLIGDGVMPSNEGRGYVLRRIMRRAIRYGRQLSDSQIYSNAVQGVLGSMQGIYPELKERSKIIVSTVEDEQKRFLKTLDQGTDILEKELTKLEKGGAKFLSGEFAFTLYDTYGFPVDLTRLMANESGFSVNEEEFNSHMQKAKEKARASWRGKGLDVNESQLIALTNNVKKEKGTTEFTGYIDTLNTQELKEQADTVLLFDGKQEVETLQEGSSGIIAFDKTCFYGESGGQVGDEGHLSWTSDSGSGSAQVNDCTKVNGIHLLHIQVKEGTLSKDVPCIQEVDLNSRRKIANNHSGTHLLHAALRNVLGDHVTQAGSLVDPQRLRFDFTHPQPLSTEEVSRIEDIVNGEIAAARKVDDDECSYDEAIQRGALALFGEKYGDKVRVIEMGPTSMELCGGTHVSNTSQILMLKIVSEGGVSSGVRRIEALTGNAAIDFVMKNTRDNLEIREQIGLKGSWQNYLDEKENAVSQWAQQQRSEIKELNKKLQSAQGNQINIESIIGDAKTFNNSGQEGRLVLADIPMDDRKVLSDISDKIKNKIQSGIVVVIGKGEGSHPIIVSVTKNLVGPFKAGDILKELAGEMGGKGGGRPDFAQGAGKDRSKLPQAFEKANALVL